MLGCVRLILILTLPITAAAGTPDSARQDESIHYLMAYVAQSPHTFVRNAKRYSGAEAAAHMHRKYQHFKDDIRTAEDFIERCASKSLLTGRTYTLVTAEGEQMPTAQWLMLELARHRAAIDGGGKANDRTLPQAVIQGEQAR